VILAHLIGNPKDAASDADAKDRKIRFFLNQAISQRILMLLLMFLQITHIKILLGTPLDLTRIFLTTIAVLKMHLNMLLQISSGRECLTTFLTNKRLLPRMDTLVPVQI
jgi:hypothetical protein